MQHCYILLGIKDTAIFLFSPQLIYNCVLVERISDKILRGRKNALEKESELGYNRE